MARPSGAISGMYCSTTRRIRDRQWAGGIIIARSRRVYWSLRDSYLFISNFCTSSTLAGPIEGSKSTVARSDSVRLGLFLPVRTRHPSTMLLPPLRRHFHDYFTTIIPSSQTIRPPLFPGPNSNSAQSAPPSTIVRIPIKFAKQHFGQLRSRGNRAYNEDWSQAGVLDLPLASLIEPVQPLQEIRTSGFFSQSPLTTSSVFYYAVFDGHGGDECSSFLKAKLHEYIEKAANDFYPVDALPSTSVTQQGAAGPAGVAEGEISQQQHRKRLQASLIAEWRDTVGSYFRRFKPNFSGPAPTSLPVKKSDAESVVGSGGSVEEKSLVPESTESVESATGDGSWESILTYAFLRADLDFITEKWKDSQTLEETTEADRTEVAGKNGPVMKYNRKIKSGSTASVALIFPPPSSDSVYWSPNSTSTLITAHIGDTRILLANAITGLATPLTSIHHPSNPLESRRLRRYAIAVISDSFGEERFGVLANTRSFGDAAQKRLGVTAEPEVTRHELKGTEWSFMVLCSDGISGVLSDQEIVDIVKEANTPEEGAKQVVKFAEEVVGRSNGGGDNATCMVVRLGGWEKRQSGGEGSQGTKELRRWRTTAPARRQ